MAETDIDMVPIYSGPYKIGAVGFIGNKAVLVASYYDDRDYDHEGKVSFGEKVGAFLLPKFLLPSSAMTKVLAAAALNSDIINRDLDFARDASLASWLEIGDRVKAAAYGVYIAPGVSELAGVAAEQITSNVAVKFLIRKGMETAVRDAFQSR